MTFTLLLLAVLACNALAWAPVITDLADEYRHHRDHNPVPSKRRQRHAHRTAAAMRARVEPTPEHPAPGTGSPHRDRVDDGDRRDMPTTGTCPETVPVVGTRRQAAA